ncbi:hypothetical protein FACS1894151_08950 [Spirochaetia bacterium]|nr:hypothetical protein FACS1894151_08950 [Spirochaetia bacterium]
MKKKYGALALVLMAALLVIAGCSNITAPDPVDTVNTELNNSGRFTTVNGGASVYETPELFNFVGSGGQSSGGLHTDDAYNLNGAEFDIVFLLDVPTNTVGFTLDAKALHDSITLREIKNWDAVAATDSTGTHRVSYDYAAVAIPADKWGVLYVYPFDAITNEAIVRVWADLGSVTHDKLEIRVDAKKFTANGGRYKLNMDEDLTAGEEEDDLYGYIDVTQAAGAPALTVVSNVPSYYPPNPKFGVGLNIFAFNGFTIAGTAGNVGAALPANLSGAVFSVTVADLADTEDALFKSIFQNNFEIQKWDGTNWVASHPITAVNHVAGTVGTSNQKTYELTFTGALEDGEILRVIIKDINKIGKTEKKYYGFNQSFTTKDNEFTKAVVYDPDGFMDLTAGTGGYFYAKYTDPGIFGAPEVISAGKGAVTVRIPYTRSEHGVGDNGLDLATVTPDNVVITKTVGSGSSATLVKVNWNKADVKEEYADLLKFPSLTVAASIPNALLITLPSSYEVGNYIFWIDFNSSVRTKDGGAARKLYQTGFNFDPITKGWSYRITGSGL